MKPAPVILLEVNRGALRGLLETIAPVVTSNELAGWPEGTSGLHPGIRVIVTGGMTPLRPAALDLLPDLGLISVVAAGYSGIDIADARQRRVAVTRSSAINHEDVADAAVAMTIAIARKIPQAAARLARGGWIAGAPLVATRSIAKRRVGIVGLGAIGRAIAHRLEAFRCPISWWGPNLKATPYSRASSLQSLARQSDILCLAASSSPDNKGLINREIIDLLGPEGIIVNVARGSLVDEDALIAALRSGRLAGAALDVFQDEPASASRWADVPNVLLTPHIAGVTFESISAMFDGVYDNVQRFLAGKELVDAIVPRAGTRLFT